LSGVGGGQVEIKYSCLVSLVASFVFNQRLIHDTARWGVAQSSIGLLDEEALGDAFVDHHYGNGWGAIGSVVEVLNHSLELGDFRSKHLFSHGVTHAITVNDEVSGLGTLVLVLEHVNGFAD